MSDVVDEGIVEQILQQDPAKPVMVTIGIHAPYFFLDRNGPNFANLLKTLEGSQRRQVPVRFTWEVGGQWLTAVELKE
jgi:hypothetical protein